MKASNFFKIFLVIFFIIAGLNVYSQRKGRIAVQTSVTTVNGDLIEDGKHNISANLYETLNSLTPVLTQNQQIQTVRGLANFEVEASDIYNFRTDQPVYVGLSLNGGLELTPRLKISPSLYSYSSGAVNGLDKVFPYEGNVGIGTLSPSATLHTLGGVRMEGLSAFSSSPQMLVGMDAEGNLGHLEFSKVFSGFDKLNFEFGMGGVGIDTSGISVIPQNGTGGIFINPGSIIFGDTLSGNSTIGLFSTSQSTFGFGLQVPVTGNKVISITPNPELGLAITDTSGNYFHHLRPDGQAYHSKGLTVGGNLFAGSLSVSGEKNFRIDHPLDPENKYLIHRSIESDDRLNLYNGNVVLNKNGEAIVELPVWFEALNTDFRYQLTAVGAPAPKLYVAEKIKENSFKIAGGKKGMEVSWQITGIRKDEFADGKSAQVEVLK